MNSSWIIGAFVFATAFFYSIDAIPFESTLICPDIACSLELCRHGEVPDLDARGCWTSCKCKVENDPCSNYQCPPQKHCELSWLTNKPNCVSNCPMHCPEVDKPVCGSDIQTYNNECELRVKACLTNSGVKKIADQACCFYDPLTLKYSCIARK